jgi:hypothetical protein
VGILVGNRAGAVTFTDDPQTVAINNTEVSPMVVSVSGQISLLTINSVTWNGAQDFGVPIGSITGGGGVHLKTYLFVLKNPAVANASVSVDYSGVPSSGVAVDVITTTGGDTVTGYRSVFTRNDTTGTGPGITITDSQNGDLCINACGIVGADIVFDGGEDSTTTEHDNPGGNGTSYGLSTKSAVGANTSVGCTDTTFYAQVAVALMPASAPGAPTTGPFVQSQSGSVTGRVEA